MVTREGIAARRAEILKIAANHGARDVRIFGSVARGDAGAASDLDLLVRFEPGRSLFDHGGLVMDLRDLLGIKVDVVDEDGMRERFRNHIQKELLPL